MSAGPHALRVTLVTECHACEGTYDLADMKRVASEWYCRSCVPDDMDDYNPPADARTWTPTSPADYLERRATDEAEGTDEDDEPEPYPWTLDRCGPGCSHATQEEHQRERRAEITKRRADYRHMRRHIERTNPR